MELERLHAIVRAQVEGKEAVDAPHLAQLLSPAARQALRVWLRQQRRAAAEGKAITPQGNTAVWNRSVAIPSSE